jgi:hypothetical protein
VYRSVNRSEIAARVKHIRDLHRQLKPTNESDAATYVVREQKTKALLSNLQRMGTRPTLQLVYEFGRLNSMTTDGAHRLFGYDLDSMRSFDTRINSARTRILESHVFERDIRIELPLELAPPDAFRTTAPLRDLVLRWQREIPIRALDRPGWRRAGTFYVRIGSEDSLGSILPPRSIAQIEPVEATDSIRPDPRAIYLLQFRNGYRCSRCVVTKGKLHLISAELVYTKSEGFAYPLDVRIVGRVHVFAMALPLPDDGDRQSLTAYGGSADLILPWEQPARSALFATEHKRFVRSASESQAIQSLIEAELGATLSERTKRRYRTDGYSEPHIDALMHMTLEHCGRYTDSLRSGGFSLSGSARFSLDALLNATEYHNLLAARHAAVSPTPEHVWEARRNEVGEWPALLSFVLPKPSMREASVIRVGEELRFDGLLPSVGPGSWLMTEPVPRIPEVETDRLKRGWSKPLYVLQQGIETVFGFLEREGESIRVRSGSRGGTGKAVSVTELPRLRQISGIVVPVS